MDSINDEEATITLYGDEQASEMIQFKWEQDEEKNPFHVIHKELGYRKACHRENGIELQRKTFILNI